MLDRVAQAIKSAVDAGTLLAELADRNDRHKAARFPEILESLVETESADMTNKRYIFCRPITGLYDTLTQIEKCWKYAKKFERTLVIDTRISGLNCEFWELFEIIPECRDVEIIGPSFELEDRTKNYPTAPGALQGRAPVKKEELAHKLAQDMLVETGESIRINLEQDYQEPKLIYIRRGGGEEAHTALSKIKLNDDTREEIISQLKHLPETYIGVHVRNTDVKTNYRKFFRRNLKALKGQNVLVCSDDQEVIDFARDFLNESIVFTTSVKRSKDGSPLHVGPKVVDRGRSIAIEALTDLVALSQAKDILHTKLNVGLGRRPMRIARVVTNIVLRRRPLRRISGFTSLALYLQKNQRIRKCFIEGMTSTVTHSD